MSFIWRCSLYGVSFIRGSTVQAILIMYVYHSNLKLSHIHSLTATVIKSDSYKCNNASVAMSACINANNTCMPSCNMYMYIHVYTMYMCVPLCMYRVHVYVYVWLYNYLGYNKCSILRKCTVLMNLVLDSYCSNGIIVP